MKEKQRNESILAAFFAEGSYTPFLNQEKEEWAGYGYIGEQAVYAVCQTGEQTLEMLSKSCDLLQMAAKTGNPIVTFYGGAEFEKSNKDLVPAKGIWNAEVSKVSGTIPQIAVVVGGCDTASALAIANSNFCIACEEAEMFFSVGENTPSPATMENNSGLIALKALSPLHAAQLAARLVVYLPSNNKSSLPNFAYTPTKVVLEKGKYSAQLLVETLADTDSELFLYHHYGVDTLTALATISGGLVGIVATDGENNPVTVEGLEKAKRFVSFCDAFAIPVVTVLGKNNLAEINTQSALELVKAMAKLTAAYADATTPKIAVITEPENEFSAAIFTGADIMVLLKDFSPLEENMKSEEIGGRVLTALQFTATPFTLRGVVASSLDMLATKEEPKELKKHSGL